MEFGRVLVRSGGSALDPKLPTIDAIAAGARDRAARKERQVIQLLRGVLRRYATKIPTVAT
jgi:hypothetical protein